ncbi:MAG: diaminopimelate epimerase [Rhodothermales bacterium]|nr:diaminopimelate epimerase [Rhodothermales bacterium]
MAPPLVVEFTKMNGAGNDFVVIDNRFYHFTDDELAALARRTCPRRTGIGADGLLAFASPRGEGHHFRMRYFNADGSLGTMCGNGARCLVRYARRAGLGAEPLVFETDAGTYRATAPLDPGTPVRLFVDPPRDWRPDRPLARADGETPAAIHYLWTGTEHAVCPVPDVASAPVGVWGPAIRHDAALAPQGANVNFVQVEEEGGGGTPAVLRVRTFEKGVEDETLACGTGALASAVAARLLGHVRTETVQVRMPGGTLAVGFRLGEGGEAVHDLYLEGPAEVVYRGTFEG